MSRAERVKLTLGVLVLSLWVLLPSEANAIVIQGIYNTVDYNHAINSSSGQTFTGISNPNQFSFYMSRKQASGEQTNRAVNVYRIRCFEDATETGLCPDGSGSLSPEGYILFNLGSCQNFVNTSASVPMTTCTVGGENVPRQILDTGFITVPYEATQKITMPFYATTTHVFNPEWHYKFTFTPVAYPGANTGGFAYIHGSANDTYPQTNYIQSGTTTTLTDMYFEYNYPGELIEGEYEPGATTPIAKNIEILNPTYGTTTATTTFGVSIKYRTPFSLDFRPTTTRYYEIVDAVTGEIEEQYAVLIPANTGENLTITATNTVSVGSKYMRAMYLDTNGQPYSEIDEVFFNVATNTYFIATGLLTPRSSPTELTQIDCTTFDIGCQFQKALTFLFKPSTDTLDKFANIWQTIKEKKPFGYVSVTIDQLKALDTSGAAAFSLGNIPFMDAIFTPFRTLFAGILWALFAIYFYQRRLIHLDI